MTKFDEINNSEDETIETFMKNLVFTKDLFNSYENYIMFFNTMLMLKLFSETERVIECMNRSIDMLEKAEEALFELTDLSSAKKAERWMNHYEKVVLNHKELYQEVLNLSVTFPSYHDYASYIELFNVLKDNPDIRYKLFEAMKLRKDNAELWIDKEFRRITRPIKRVRSEEDLDPEKQQKNFQNQNTIGK